MASTKVPIELSSTPGIVDNSNATAITIDSSENVGIGRTPNANGILQLNVTTGNNCNITFSENTTEKFLIVSVTSSNAFRIYDLANSSERLRIDSSGNVGIGTSSPARSLHIRSTGEGSGLFLERSSNYGFVLYNEIETTTETFHLGFVSNGTFSSDILVANELGNVGIGTSSPNDLLHIVKSDASTTDTTGLKITNSNITTNSIAGILFENYDSNNAWIRSLRSPSTQGTLTFGTNPGTGVAESNIQERMRITSNGELLLNRTGIFGTGNTCSAFIQGKSTAAMYVIGTNTSGYQLITFFNGSLNVMGSITHNNTSVTYGTSSDYRLKENVVELDGAIDRVKLLQPKRFNFIADAENTVDGFLAHEVADVVPEAITGVKDEMQEEEYEVTPAVLDEDGNVVTEAVMGTREVPKYQNIDQSKLVPLLTKAIQEQQVLIEQLQAEVALLKGE
jgi:hypothetical protein